MRIKNYILSVLILLCSYNITAQVVTPFTQRLAGGSLKLKGDIVFVGNNIVNRTNTNPTYDGANNVTNQAVLTAEANTPYNGTLANNNFNFDYIDIDGDPTTFSSSTADLNIVSPCKKIIYAGLYWTATYPFERIKSNGTITIPRQNDWNQVKFKLPGGAYQTLVADNAADPVGQEDDIIVDNNTSNTNGVYGVPYVCYKNVTSLLQGLANANGTYAVANQRGQLGKYTNTGSSAGWSIVIIYEDPSLPSKYISVFDGYANIDGGAPVDFNINGFQTLPPPFPVKARIGVGALEGDYEYTGDNLSFKANSLGGFTTITNGLNPLNNFFNSSITNNNVAITNRNINSSNTLGFDLDLVQVNNPLNAVIPNNETGATLRLTTNGDSYGAYITTFDVEIIEPKIILTKTVADLSGADVGGQNVTLCQPLNYTIGFQNIGNDAADVFTIRDVLPPNVSFNPASVVLPTPPVTVPVTPAITFVYTAATRTIVFTIPKGFVTVNAPRYTIQLGVKVLCTCLELDDACSNLITNQAFATYQGVLNTAQISNDPSLSSYTVCNLSGASPTNTLVGLDSCNFTQDVVLCGTTVTLTAAGGYTTYTWSGPPGATITPVAGTNNQSVVVNQVGTYTVNNLINITPCKSIVQTINVVDITGTPPLTNPVLPYADQIVICPNDNKQLPLIFLCGAADSQLIATTITGATSISWEQLNTGSCAAVVNPNCANENAACTWTNVGTGLNYTANNAGQFRVVIVYPGGCQRIFYFNVFKNLLNPIATPRDAVCSTPGQITITGVPAGYEYSLDCTATWQASNVFLSVPVGVHSVCIRQTGIVGGCVFTLTNIPIVNRVFTVSAIITQPICSGDKGSINLAANNVLPQYTFSINQGAVLISTFGPTNSSSTVFNNLTPGNYTYTVTTQDGCSVTTPFTINQPPLLTITAALTKPLTSCGPGEITVYPVGGTPPYNFNVTGAVTVTQSSPIISAPVAGIYNIQVVDNNNCTANVSITVALVPPPVYTVTQTNVLCYGSNTGAINFNVTNANGFTLAYSIDGINFFPTPNFPNLVAGTYTIIVRYTLGTAVCLTTPVTITITQPAAALTASAGVSELAGCGPLGEGRVRIINPQGGVPPYTYSFDNQATYTAVNQAYLLPGTYTVYIKDANGCIFPMTVTLDPAPAPPTIVVTPPVFACNGNATSTVTVNNNGGSFIYTYLLDGVPNTPPTNNVFTPVTCGPHTVTVNYQATNIPTPSNLLFEDFGIGANTTTPGIAAAYCFNPQAYPAGQPCGNAVAGFPASACGTWFVNDNQYVVTPLLNPNNCAWFPYRDHTSNGTNPKGRFLAVNIGSAAGPNGVLYSKTINNVLPNQPVIVDIYLANLLTVGNGGADPSFILELVDGAGTVIASQSTGIIDNTVNAWQLKSLSLNPGPNTTLIFKIRSGSIIYGGNDAAIDDINVYQQPIACITTRNFPINIACNQAFTAQVTGSNNVSCNGGNNGTITISAQNFAATGFQYSTNGGGTWITSLVSPVTINALTAATYNIQIRYDSNPANTACSFPFTTVITQPAALVPSVIVTPATCLTGATITASAVGGTPAYQYQLQTSPGAVIVRPYQASGIFTNVPAGNYVVLIRDANLCTSSSILVSVVAATPPTATISLASNFCYSSPSGATIIVTPAGGVAPYTYTINGVPNATNVFSNLTPGSYTIIVTDAFGCTVTLPVQTIAPQLTLSTVLTKDLDCTASPNAVITGTIAGGYSPYTYQVSFNGAPFANLGATTSPFTYSTAVAGTYQFQVTDSRGCVAQSIIHTVNALVPVTATHTQINNKCFGDTAGSVTITPSGGVAPYVISFNGSPFTSTTTYSGLSAGTYPYIVRDSKFCTFNGSVTITQPAQIAYTAIVNPITCSIAGSGYALGSICVNGLTGGVAPYTYTLVDITNGGAVINHVEPLGANYCFPNVDFGLYDLSVKDANGCTIVKSNLVMASPPGGLNFTFASVASCATGADLTVSISGGVIGSGPYEFGIVNLTAFPWSSTFMPANPGPATHIFTNLIPGTIYTIVVRDLTTGCYYFQTAPTAATLSTINVTPLVANPVTCNGSADGSVTFGLTGIDPTTTSITYSVHYASNNLPVSVATTGILTAPFTMFPFTTGPLSPGSYNIQIVEYVGAVRGCGVTSINFTIVESATALTLSAATTNDNCNLNAGHIAPIASGGTGPYTYQYLPSPSVAPTAASAGWVATNPFNGESGNYDVYVKDANGCIKVVTVVIGLDPSPIINATLVNACVAQGTYQIHVEMPTAGVAPYTFSIDGGAFVTNTTPFNISGLSSGTHTVEVRDKNGCGNGVQTVTILAPLTVSAVFTIQPTCFNNNGTITASASGGSAPANYTYTLLTSASVVITGPQGSNVFASQPAGCYIIRVTDSATGCSANTPFCLALPTPVTFTAIPTNVTCSGGTDGTITINLPAANNNPAYTYQIIAPLAFATGPQASNVFLGLPAGTYTVQVNSGRGCTLIDNNVIVGTPAPIVVPATTITQFGCNAGTNAVNLATITVTGVTGGSGVYTNYEFILGGVIQQSGSSNTYSTANVAGGTYTINVYDNKGCLGTTTAIINAYISISNPTVVVDSPITCTTNEQITISVTVAGGAPPVFSYTVTGYPTNAIPYNVTQNSPTFTGLTIGDYLITVLNPVTGCSVQTIHYVFNPNTFGLLLNNVVDVTCFGGNNGSVDITIVDNDLTPTNDAGPFNYTILDSLGATVASGVSPTVGPITVSGLPSGIYTANVSLTATPFCTVTKNFTISGPTSALGISATSSPITCVTGNNDGTITASATGGWGAPYEFQLQIGAAIVGTYTYSANANFTGLTQATYTVYVRDVKGCITSTNVTLTNPTPINAVITSSGPTVTCFGDCNATISISYPTGGQGSNYSYVLHSTIPTVSDSGPIAIPLGGIVLTGLCADTYSVTITDGFDCSFTSANIVIAQPAKVVASLSTATTQTCLTQATLTLTGSGGTPPYSYSATVGGPFIGSFNPSTVISVPVGTYNYYIQDANGCKSLVSGDVIITPLDPLIIAPPIHQDILCGGSATGTISATATGGLLNYVYTLLDGAGNPILPAPTQTTPGNFSNLPAGTYIVHVQSLDCAVNSISVIIFEPTPFNVVPTSIPVKCNGGNDGAVNLVITGGTGAIQYAISPNLSQFITITNPYVAGGFNVPNLASGSYTIIIQDENGCFVTFNNITINQPTALTYNITSFVDEDCAELDLGEITVAGIGGGTAPYSIGYTVVYPGSSTVVNGPIVPLAPGVTTYTFTGLNGGNYTVFVIDGNNCNPSGIDQIIGSGVLYEPRAEVTFPCVSNSPAVRVEVLNLSNTPSLAFTPLSDYLFSLDVNSSAGAQASNIFTSAAYPSLLIPGSHIIYVFHVNGCDKATIPFTINATDIDPLNLILTQVFLNQLVATLNPVTGGTAPYTYTFQDETGATVQYGPNNIHIYDHTATYTVTVTDSKGCTDTETKAVVFIPIKIDNVYTPGDGSGWGPKNTSNYPDIVTYIYDRYGRKVAELLEGQKWYGKYNGQELPSGDYWYVIKVDAGNNSEYVGHFTLYR